MDFSEITFKEAIEEVLAAQNSDKLKERILGSLDLVVADCDEDKRLWADYIYKKQEKYLNPYDGIHGGIACTLADSCMGTTLCAATQDLPSTSDMSVSFLRPMTGDSFRIHVHISMIGKQLAACSCEIADAASGKLCVTVMARFVLVKKDILADDEASRAMRK